MEKLGIKATVAGTAILQKGSFHSAVLTHPTGFHPTPQDLAAGSKVQYTALGSTTVLGLEGTASDSAAADDDTQP